MIRTILLFLIVIGWVACQRPDKGLPGPKETKPSDTPPVAAPQGKGTDIGSGGDNLTPFAGTAWFLGKQRPIHYCFKMGADFGVEVPEIHADVKRAITTWKTYVEERLSGIHSVLDPQSHLTTNFEPAPIVTECTGTEDLVFYFGKKDAEIDSYFSHYTNPTAFAQRQEVHPKEGWSRGFLYVAPHQGVDPDFPNWKKEGTLYGILLHELGHVLGNGHITGTIMDERINYFLRECGAWSYTHIDSHRELIHWTKSAFTVKTRTASYFHGDSEKVFRALMGREPKGDIWAQLQRLPGQFAQKWVQVRPDLGWFVPLTRHAFLAPLPGHQLTLGDEEGEVEFGRIENAARATIGQVGPGTFFVYLPYRERKEYLSPDLSPTYFETLVAPDKSTFAMSVEYGLMYPIQKVCYKSGIAPINLSVVIDGQTQHIARFGMPEPEN